MKHRSGSGRERARSLEAARATHLERRLLAYAMAGAGIVVLTPEADAEIIYTPAHVLLTHGALEIDLDNDGNTDFVIHDRVVGSSSSYYGSLRIAGANPRGGGVLGKVSPYGEPLAFALPLGSPIDSQSPNVFL